MDPIRYAWNCCNPHVPFPVVLARSAAATGMVAELLPTREGSLEARRFGEGVFGDRADEEIVEYAGVDELDGVADAPTARRSPSVGFGNSPLPPARPTPAALPSEGTPGTGSRAAGN